MKNNPYFSIIIPTLNEEKFLPRLLKNLADQSFKNFEVIHVDGKSEDKTVSLAQKIAPRLPSYTLLTSPKRNVSVQRNLGAKNATGEYFLFIDADTQLPSNFLKTLHAKLKNNPSHAFTTWAIPDSKNPADASITLILNLAHEASRILNSPAATGVFIGCSRQAFQETKGFPIMKYGEDEEFIKDIVKHGYKFIIYHQPQFIFSLRRFRKEGTLPTFRQFASKHLKFLTENVDPGEYKMGGHNFNSDNPNQAVFTSLDSIFRQVPKKPQIKRVIKKFIDNL